MINLNILPHKDSWDWYVLLLNFAVFGLKKGKRIMECKFWDGKTGKKEPEENDNNGREKSKIPNWFYKPLIISVMHYVQHGGIRQCKPVSCFGTVIHVTGQCRGGEKYLQINNAEYALLGLTTAQRM